MRKKVLFLSVLICLTGVRANAELKDGENISYTLSLGIIKAGQASLSTSKTTFEGEEAYSVTLTANTSKAADRIYRIRDTLTATVSPQAQPLKFHKHCFEGDDIVTEDAEFFRTTDGQYRGKMAKLYKDGHIRGCDTICRQPIYDMVSITLYARTLQFDEGKTGQRFQFELADGGIVESNTLVYIGRESIKVSGSQKKCLTFSVRGPKDDKEILRIFVTDDDERIPVGLDISLPFGKAKARLN